MPVYREVVTIDHPVLGGSGTNTWHIRTTGGGGSFDELGDATEAIQAFYVACGPVFTGTTVFAFDGVAQRLDEEEPSEESTDPWTFTAPGSSNSLPPATAICVNWKASTGGRKGKGRTFLGPISSNANDPDGTPSATELGRVRSAAQALVDASDSSVNGWAIAVWSRLDSTARDFIASSVNDQFASLRSRRD